MKYVPLKYLASIVLGKMLQSTAARADQSMHPYLKASTVTESGLDLTSLHHMPFTPREQELLQLRKDDVVVVEGGSIGRSVWVSEDMPGIYFQNSINRVRPKESADGRYLRYAIESRRASGFFDAITNQATIRHLTADKLANTPVPYFERKWQSEIADYLDHETAEIDAFIAAQEQLSSLLLERWQSLLVHLVQTNERDGGQLRNTGVTEWPHAPKHWMEMRLKSTIFDSQNGSWGSEPDVDSVTRRCIRVADFDKNSGRIHSKNETERSYPLAQVKSLELQPGNLIIEKSGGGPTTPVGNTVLYDGPGGDMFSNFVARIRLRSNVTPLYAVYLHRSLYLNKITQRSIKQTTGIQNLDSSSYFNETIFLPPLDEQNNIGHRIEANRIETNESLHVIEKAIDLARERRAALITAAVTGQIDVTAKNKPAAEQLEDDIAQGRHRESA